MFFDFLGVRVFKASCLTAMMSCLTILVLQQLSEAIETKFHVMKPKMSGVFFKNPAQICWMTSSIHKTQSYKCQSLNPVKG